MKEIYAYKCVNFENISHILVMKGISYTIYKKPLFIQRYETICILPFVASFLYNLDQLCI